MKRISTFVLMALFCCLGAFAQVELGDIKFSIKDGQKINPVTGKITISFPNVTGVETPNETPFVIAGNFGNEDLAFDGVEGMLGTGITIDLVDYGLEYSSEYTLTITSVKVNEVEYVTEGTTYAVTFKTRSAERKMSWTFTIDAESAAQIVAEGSLNPASDTADVTKYMDIQKDGSTTHRYYVPSRNYEEILLPDGSLLPMTEDLYFKFGNKAFYVGDTEGSYKDLIAFNGKNQYLVIPDCEAGDVITFNANRATKGSASKPTNIMAMNGAAIAPDGQVSTATGLKDSIWLGSNYANYKFEVQTDGDITFFLNNCLMKSINIEKGQPKVPCTYNVKAVYTDGENVTELKELLPATAGTTGTTLHIPYPYWLVDTEGNAYTKGTKGNEFTEAFELKGDTTFVINYNKTDYTGVVFLSEGEDLEGAVECLHANAAIRSSNAKSGYLVDNSLKLVTLQPGTYKVRAVLFDANKTPSYTCTLTKGEGEENKIVFVANATNWTETESDLLTITEATDITLLPGGSDTQGLDIIMIYASTDAPEDPDGIVEVNSSAKKVSTCKVLKNGQILIQTKNGLMNVAGVLVK